MAEKSLITLEQIDPLKVFVEGEYLEALEYIKEASKIENPTTETKKGRDLIRSTAAKISSSKVFVEKAGKGLADKEREKIEKTVTAINASRNFIKDALTYHAAEVRKPLTDYETAKKAEEDEAKYQQGIIEKHVLALGENAEKDRVKKIEVENAKLKKESDQREAVEDGKKEVQKKADDEKEADRQKEAKRKDTAATTRQNMLKNINVVLDWGTLREMEEGTWSELFEKNNKEYRAAQNQKIIDAEREKQRLADEKKLSDQKAREANQANRKKVNNAALVVIDKILAMEPNPKLTPGQQIIIAISKNEVPGVFIKY